MKILEWLLNLAFDMASLWDRTSDRILHQHRTYERRIFIFSCVCLMFLAIYIQMTPSIHLEPTAGISYVIYSLKLQFATVAIWISLITGVASIYNLIGLIRFRYEHGIVE